MEPHDRLAAAVRKLVGQTGTWTPSRWAASGASGVSRAVVVHGLVQWLADRSAEAEGRPPLPVPRLDNDLALPDQLQVVAADVARHAPAAAVTAAAEQILATRAAL